MVVGMTGSELDKPQTIDDATVEEIERELNAARPQSWISVYLELQEDGAFLHVSVELQSDASPEAIGEACSLIMDVVAPRIPAVGDHIPWIAGVKVNGKVVDSVVPGMPEATRYAH